MIKILFVCHGNICRSPMAEYVMKYLTIQAGAAEDFFIDSAATSTEEIGNGIHYGTRRKLEQVGIPCGDHRARQLTRRDYKDFDLLIGMDGANLRNMRRICGGDPEGKMSLMMEWAGCSVKTPVKQEALLGRGGAEERARDALQGIPGQSGLCGDVADPWYTGDFEATYRDVREGCEGLLARLAER